MKALRIVLMAALLVPPLCFAQKKIPIEVSFAGDGGVTPNVARELREAIRAFNGPLVLPHGSAASSEAFGMRVTTELAKPRIRLQLAGTEAAGGVNAIAVTVLYDSAMVPLGGAYIRSILVTCGADAAACAKDILTQAHGSMTWLRERWPSIWNTL